MSSSSNARLESVLGTPLSSTECASDMPSLQRAACDVFFEGSLPLAVLRPRDIAALAAWLPRLADARIAIVPQGACLSYCGGTIGPSDRPWVALDLRGLNRILEIDATDGCVRVEAGCTWSALREALAPRGLRTPFWGPFSGRDATIGGSVAVDALFFGSAAHGSVASAVTGLTVLLSNGQSLRTGLSAGGQPSFAHPFGPDLTGLFVGSCGAFGIIVEVTMPVIMDPVHARFAGLSCSDASVSARVLRRLAASRLCSEAVLLDPAAAGMAMTTTHVLSIAVEADSVAEATTRLSRVIETCVAAGATYVDEGSLRAVREMPFGPPTMVLDTRGRRWVPVHGLVAHSRLANAMTALTHCMAQHAALCSALSLEWNCTCALVGTSAVLVEIHLYWPDGGNALIESYLGGMGAKSVPPNGRAGWSRILPLREALSEALAGVGASHLQIGRFYRHLSRLEPSAAALLETLKTTLDPHSVMNPGALGLGAGRQLRDSELPQNHS
jgi:glycolate oxidase